VLLKSCQTQFHVNPKKMKITREDDS
jgi:hypothetical protein